MSNTSSIVSMLEAADLGVIRSLRDHYPDTPELLSSAIPLGDEETAPPTARAFNREATKELVIKGAETARTQLDDIANFILGRMRNVNRAKLLGAVVATISGGTGAILSYAGVGQEAAKLAMAMFGFAGGATSLAADQFEKSPSGIRVASVEEHGKLVSAQTDLELMLNRLGRDHADPVLDNDLRAMVTALDDIARDVIRLKYNSR